MQTFIVAVRYERRGEVPEGWESKLRELEGVVEVKVGTRMVKVITRDMRLDALSEAMGSDFVVEPKSEYKVLDATPEAFHSGVLEAVRPIF